MAITKENKVDKVEVVGDYKAVQIRTATIIKEDGVELTRSYHRKVIHPDMDVTNEDAEVKSITNVVWTQAVKDAWTAKLAADNENS